MNRQRIKAYIVKARRRKVIVNFEVSKEERNGGIKEAKERGWTERDTEEVI